MRRSIALAFGIFAMSLAGTSLSQTWPTKPVRLLVGFSAGGTTDIVARKLAQPLGAALGQNIVVENRTGASGMIASGEIARAPADGYTIGMVISSNVSVPAIGRKVPFHPVDSFEPLVLVGKVPMALTVSNNLGVNTVGEFVALAKKKPGTIFFSSPGIGLAHHFAGELFKLQAGIAMTHAPYAGAAPALNDVMAGQVQATFAAVPTAAPVAEAGKAKVLAISGKQRAPRLPAIPTIAESGYPDYDISEWFGLVAPANTPKAVVERLNQEINKILDTPEWQKWLSENAFQRPADRSTAEFRAFMKAEAVKFNKIAKDANIVDAQ